MSKEWKWLDVVTGLFHPVLHAFNAAMVLLIYCLPLIYWTIPLTKNINIQYIIIEEFCCDWKLYAYTTFYLVWQKPSAEAIMIRSKQIPLLGLPSHSFPSTATWLKRHTGQVATNVILFEAHISPGALDFIVTRKGILAGVKNDMDSS